jgi:hypothetical protein
VAEIAFTHHLEVKAAVGIPLDYAIFNELQKFRFIEKKVARSLS